MTWMIVCSVLALAACVGLCALVVRRDWLARLENGFVVTLTIVLVGVGMTTAVLLGIWGYASARHAMFQEVADGIADVGRIAETQLQRQLRVIQDKLNNLAEDELLEQAKTDPDVVRDKLRELHTFNPNLLQLSIFDLSGSPLVVTSRSDGMEPVNRVGTAFGLEGKSFISEPYRSPIFEKYVFYVSTPVRGADDRITGAMSLRYDLQEELSGLLGAIRFGQSGYTVLVDSGGRVLAHADPGRIGDDVSEHPAFRAAARHESGWVVARGPTSTDKLYVYRQVHTPATLEKSPMVLVAELDQSEVLAPLHRLAAQLAIGVFSLTALWIVLAWWTARVVTRPLADLLAVVRRVRDGNLAARAQVAGRDEIGQFAHALNQMVQGLQERDRIKQTFGRYVTQQVAETILNGNVNLGGQSKRVTILFSDIRNFSAMSEELTPQQVVELLNEYFSEMVDAVFEHGGVLDKFIGDGLMAVFGALDDQPDHCRRAVLAALRMKAKLAKINGERAIAGKTPISIGIGVHTDEVVVGNIGSHHRLEYTVIGDGVNTCSRVESMNKDFGTTLLITEQTHEQVRSDFECRPMPETRLRGKTHPVRLFEVLSHKSDDQSDGTNKPLAA